MNEKDRKVILVTVTFNSSHFLKRLITAVAAESYPVQKLIVVDNNSSSEHKAVIASLAKEYPFVEVVTSESNLGGAGGFETGIRTVLDKGYVCDDIWIMDDDAFPREDCLEILAAHMNDEVGAVVPMIFGVDFQRYQFFHHKRESKYLDTDIRLGNCLDDFYDGMEVETNAFVGPLIRLSVIKDVGLPDGGLFIYGDDTEYMYRISRKYKVILAKEAVINHRDIRNDAGVVNPKGIWKDYYKYRNRFLFVQKYKKSFQDGLRGKWLVAVKVAKEIHWTRKNPGYNGIRKPRRYCLFQALKDGLRNKGGKTIDPQEFNTRYGL